MKKSTAFLLCALLTGCTGGPNKHRPAVRPRPAFNEPPASPTPPPTTQAGIQPQDVGTWTVAQPSDAKIRGDWWAVFNEPELNDLEAQLNINNQNLKLYFENYMEARALVREA